MADARFESDGYLYVGRGEKDLYECLGCGARMLPGVFDPEHEAGCEVAKAEAVNAGEDGSDG